MRKILIITALILAVKAFSATITPSGTLTAGLCKHGYTVQLSTTGLVSPVTFSLTAGGLPPGVTLSTGGLIQGIITTTSAATYTFSVRAKGTGTVVATSSNTIAVTAINNLTLSQMYNYWTAPTYPIQSQVFDTWSTVLSGSSPASFSITPGSGITAVNGPSGATVSVTSPITTAVNLCRSNLIFQPCDSGSFLSTGQRGFVWGKNYGARINSGSFLVELKNNGDFNTATHQTFLGASTNFFASANTGMILQADATSNPSALTMSFGDNLTYLNGKGGVNISDTLDVSLSGGVMFTRDSLRFLPFNYKISSTDGRRQIKFGTNIDINTNQYGNVNINGTSSNLNGILAANMSSDNGQANVSCQNKVVQISAAKDNFSVNVIATVDSTQLRVESGDISIFTAGKGLKVKGGSNAKQGQASLSGTSVVVSNTSVTANSRILLTEVGAGSLGNVYVAGVTPASSFTITAPVTHTTTVNYFIFESQ